MSQKWFPQVGFCTKNLILTEQEIIQGCINGNARSQKMLYDRFSGRMYAVCLRYARRTADAKDILQDGFVKVYENLKSYRGDGSFEGWIRRIMVNTAIRMYQRHRFKFEFSGIEPARHDTAVNGEALEKLSATELLGMVNELPEGYKIVFNLVAIEGYSHSEVAEMLEIEESTSRSQLTKARRHLIAKFEEKSAFGTIQKVA